MKDLRIATCYNIPCDVPKGNFVTFTAEFDASSEYSLPSVDVDSKRLSIFLLTLIVIEISVMITKNSFFNLSRFIADSPYSAYTLKHEAYWIVDGITQSGEA